MLFDTVKNLCQSKKCTMAELERSVQFGKGSIQKWKKSFPSVDRLMRVADYFGVSTDYLLGREKASEPGRTLVKMIDRLPKTKQSLLNQYIRILLGE